LIYQWMSLEDQSFEQKINLIGEQAAIELQMLEEKYAAETDLGKKKLIEEDIIAKRKVSLAKKMRKDERSRVASEIKNDKKDNATKLRNQKQFFSLAVSLANSKNKTLADIGRTAALAQIIMKTPEAVANSFTFGTGVGGPVVGALFGGIAAAAMAAQAAEITKGYNYGGVVTQGPSVGDQTTIRVNRGERVLTERQNAAFERISLGGAGNLNSDLLVQLNNTLASKNFNVILDNNVLNDSLQAERDRSLSL